MPYLTDNVAVKTCSDPMEPTSTNIAPVELLAPASDLATGIAAIRAGADAVYIGGPVFGARREAANNMDDVAALVKYAHAFGVRVYMTLNTILFDDELDTARDLAVQAWDAEVDALIVQDMAFAEMDLPPIALHASTQAFNLEPERIKFLENAGFSRVILERGAGIKQIRAIREATSLELEAFVHGAICVSYSGQCYLGHWACGRGGNRGACAQPCRARYDLLDQTDNIIVRDSHLLSPADLNLSRRIPELAEAGVASFKIEGRLKDESYIVNVTAHYSRLLDSLGLPRTSSGDVSLAFEPDPERSFSRGFTEYFFDGPRVGTASGQSAKALGERIGKVRSVSGDFFELDGQAKKLNPGDGICFADEQGRIAGTNINRTADGKVWPNKMESLRPEAEIYRNFDRLFRPGAGSAERNVAAQIAVDAGKNMITLAVTDRDGNRAEVTMENTFDPARNPGLAERSLTDSLSKSGGTIFHIAGVTVGPGGNIPFIPAATVNAARRELLGKLHDERLSAHRRPERKPEKIPPAPYPAEKPDYRANVSNRLAGQFYKRHGVREIERALELSGESIPAGRELMRTPYCIRRETGQCLIEGKFPVSGKEKFPVSSDYGKGPLCLENNGRRLGLRFDCAKCEMSVVALDEER